MTPQVLIDLGSDTATRPSDGMREAMASAAVGDEQKDEDPTTRELCDYCADLLGMEAAVLLPSGIMANLIAGLTHCGPGDEILCAADSHIVNSEGAGLAVVGGLSLSCIPAERGIFSVEQMAERVRKERLRAPRTRLVHIEQTTNRGGGAIWPADHLVGLSDAARGLGLALHMDGARLLNAAVASGLPARIFTQNFDSVWIDLSKGLGAPVGSVLAGSKSFIESAWRWKHRLGGAMRQSGVLAAAGLYALKNNVDRLADDHRNARTFAEEISSIPGIRVENPEVETNIVFFDVAGTGQEAPRIAELLMADGVRIGAETGRRMRAVTHLGVNADQTKQAANILRTVVSSG